MIRQLLNTDANYVYCFLRLVAGIIIFPYGMQKLLGWFADFGGGVGIEDFLVQFKKKGILQFIAWMVIIGQSLGNIALIAGFAGRIAAAGNFIIFTGALVTHASGGWVMNWTGRKKGEGISFCAMVSQHFFAIYLKH